MIVSHRHGFIFVKTRKTAGTSVELELSRHLGPADIVTPVTPEDEALRRDRGGVGPQNTRMPGSADGEDRHFYNHCSAAEIRAALGAEIWSSYRTFTIERNPWEKAVSSYFWRTKDLPSRPPFRAFLAATEPHYLSNYELYADAAGLLVDHVIRYENLADELAALWPKLGLDGPPALPRAKGGVRPRVDWRAFYEADDITVVGDLCSREIELFGYEF